MKPDTISWNNGFPLVFVKPEEEKGLIIGKDVHDPRVVRAGGSLILMDVTVEDARSIESGEASTLENYLVPDPDEPSTYRVQNSKASLGGMSDNGPVIEVTELAQLK